MPLISQTINSLVAGISQQPDILRHPEQLETQINAVSTEASGLQKRPPTIHIAMLDKTINTLPLIHTISRDETERYIVMFDGTGIDVWDTAGNKKLVSYAEGAQSYIQTNSPRTKLKCVTIADHTFIANIDKTVGMSLEKSEDYWANQGALVNIKSGQYGRTYRIEINGTAVASIETPDGGDPSHSKAIATDKIASDLAAQARTNGWTVLTGPSWLYLTGKTITSLNVFDGYNNQAAIGILKSVQKFANLPSSAPDNFTVKIAGENGSTSDDYYVQYDATENVWGETVKPGIPIALDNSTMPHTLVRQADGSFILKQADWGKRTVGDEDSNPLPSFVDNTIHDVFFFRNRLGFIASENVILTKSADFFQFWIGSAVELQDTDPIDLANSASSISTLHHAVPFGEDLICFSENAQFGLSAEGVLSPKNAKLDTLTSFGGSTKVRPVAAGKNIYFPAERTEFSSIKEYFTMQDGTGAKNAQDVTSHVPNYIPNGIHRIIASSVENVLLFLTEGQPDTIYVYKYLFLEGARRQAAWSHWTLAGEVLGGDFIESCLYLVIKRGDKLFLERLTLTYNTKDFEGEYSQTYLDRKIHFTIPDGSYDALRETSTFDIGNAYGDRAGLSDALGIITPDGDYRILQIMPDFDGKITLDGNWNTIPIIVGQLYEMTVVFSRIYIKKTDETGTKATTEGRLQLRYFWVDFADSGTFDLVVEHLDKDAYLNTYRPLTIGTQDAKLNAPARASGKFKVPVQSINTNARLTVTSYAPCPVSLVSAGWEANYNRRSRQY